MLVEKGICTVTTFERASTLGLDTHTQRFIIFFYIKISSIRNYTLGKINRFSLSCEVQIITIPIIDSFYSINTFFVL